jgi:signal transduction histidine kinase
MKVAAVYLSLVLEASVCSALFATGQIPFAAISPTPPSAAPLLRLTPQKRVLLFYDARSDMESNVVVDRAIRSVLNPEFNVDLDIRSEYSELSALTESNYSALVPLLRKKYAGITFDVVVAVGRDALRFVCAYDPDLFHGAPIVYWGRKTNSDDEGPGPPITGVVAPTMAAQIVPIVQFIRTLQPDLKQLIIVTGTAPGDLNWEEAARTKLHSFEDQTAITYLARVSLEDVQKHLANLPKKSAVLFLTMDEDAAGRHLSKYELLNKLVKETPAPIYSTSAVHLDTGIVGGFLVNQETMAVDAAGLIKRLLRGENIQDMPIQESALVPTANWTALSRWNIPVDRLPPGTVVMYKDESVWAKYKWHILGALSLCVFEAALIIALIANRARLKRAQNAQQQLAGQLLRAQDEAQRQIARDLHDVTVQDLAAVRVDLNAIDRAEPGMSSGIHEKFQSAVSLCDQAMKDLRTLSYLLHPPLLDEAGLVPALQSLVRGFSQRSGIQVELVIGEIGRLDSDIEMALFRVVQESLTNVHRHSGSTRAFIWLTKEKGTVRVRIMDEGHGFLVPAGSDGRESGVGIMGMRQRIKQFGGDLEIESNSHGTTVDARIAIQEKRNAAHSSSR